MSELAFHRASTGVGRFFGAGFLLVWLSGWFVGEAFGVVMLGAMLVRLAAAPFAPAWVAANLPKVAGPGAFCTGSFLILWLGLWTVGGIGAVREVCRLLWGEDALALEGGDLVVRTRWAPGLVRERRVPRDEVRRVEVRPGGLVAETARGEVTLTHVVPAGELADLRDQLARALGLAAGEALDAEDATVLPEGWESAREGDAAVLRRSLRTRRHQAIFAGGLAAALAGGLAATAASPGEATAGLLAAGGVAVLLLVTGALWLALGSTDYLLEPGRVTRRRRWLGFERALPVEPATVVLETSRDSDGDHHHALSVRGPGARLGLGSRLNDARELQHLGRWVVARTGGALLLEGATRA